MEQVRTRFAPSPTGALHAGAVRTALFAYLVAKHSNGKFILRIEDTDQLRNVDNATQNIIDSLKYLGLNWDEGPDIGGSFGPYTQSQRLDIYKSWANKLITDKRAYVDPYSKEELEALRTKAKTQKKPFLFRDHRPTKFETWNGTKPLRFLSEPKTYKWNDAIMGNLSSGPESIDDFIIIKSDGFPTYNFAHIIDDYLMKISHVIRSQEFLPSVPKFLNLYEALNIQVPIMATPPQVLNENNSRKLSKREGAKQLLEYKKIGILPEAMINMIASLGWNDGTNNEIFSLEQLVKIFELSRVQRSGARFSEQRLLWLNGYYIRHLDENQLLNKVKSFWPKSATKYSKEYKLKVLNLIKERLKYLDEIPKLSEFFFSDLPINNQLILKNSSLSKLKTSEIVDLLKKTKASLMKSDFSIENLTEKLNELLKLTNQPPAILFSLIRIATTQSPASPAIFETLNVLDKDRSLKRIDALINNLSEA
ncbi:MAG TPA: glutamate--tRNA ligase [Candidatus Saccharimonadia bacterium]|nr:glutamate--tRNA ligase [Candidatus Saccharimonadia bacterium]